MQIRVAVTIYASAPRFTCLKGYQNQPGVFLLLISLFSISFFNYSISDLMIFYPLQPFCFISVILL